MTAKVAELPPLEIEGRVARTRRVLAEMAGALIVTGPQNIRWLTRFSGSSGIVLLTDSQLVLVTDGRYREQATDQLAGVGEIRIDNDPAAIASEVLRGCRVVGLEADHVTWARQLAIADRWLPGVELVPTQDLILGLRAIKDEAEVARIAAAAAISDGALADVVAGGLAGRTEVELAVALEVEMRRAGAEGVAFELIVASGPNSARPHHRPGPRRIGPGDLVVFDIGATVDGYRSDMTRTYCVGRPTDRDDSLLRAVTAAQAAGVAVAGPGIGAAAVDAACRDHLGQAGLGEAFVHGTGHGVGLQIHEPPWLNSRSTETLQAGHVVTVEPGAYFPGHGGARVEDTLLITDDGARPMTMTPKVPTVVR